MVNRKSRLRQRSQTGAAAKNRSCKVWSQFLSLLSPKKARGKNRKIFSQLEGRKASP